MQAILIKYSVKGEGKTFFFSCDENVGVRELTQDIMRMMDINCNMKERLFWEALNNVAIDIDWEAFSKIVKDALIVLYDADTQSEVEAFYLRRNSSTLIQL